MKKNECGSCTLCCTLMPVSEIKKPSNQDCTQQKRGFGCRIYQVRPVSCRAWSCRWLANDDGLMNEIMKRPDECHYVIDPTPDTIVLTPKGSTNKVVMPIVQVWVDPAFPDAHKDHALRAYLYRKSLDGFAALIRYSEQEGFALFSPHFTGHDWFEHRAGVHETRESYNKVLREAEGNGETSH